MKTFYIKVSDAELSMYGLIGCECGHAKTNHFSFKKKPCARKECNCKCYKPKVLIGKIIKPLVQRESLTNVK